MTDASQIVAVVAVVIAVAALAAMAAVLWRSRQPAPTEDAAMAEMWNIAGDLARSRLLLPLERV